MPQCIKNDFLLTVSDTFDKVKPFRDFDKNGKPAAGLTLFAVFNEKPRPFPAVSHLIYKRAGTAVFTPKRSFYDKYAGYPQTLGLSWMRNNFENTILSGNFPNQGSLFNPAGFCRT